MWKNAKFLSAAGLAATCLIVTPLHAQAIESLDRIQSVASAALRERLPESARIIGGSIDPRLRLPACVRKPEAMPPNLRGASASVLVRCTQPAWSVYVPLTITDLRPIAVLARAGNRGQALDPGMIEMQTRDVARLPFGYYDSVEAVEGYELRRSLNAGSVITPNDAQPPRLVRRGQMVNLVSRIGGLEVRASGTALADGGRGERVRVRNRSSKRVVEGTVGADGSIEIAP